VGVAFYRTSTACADARGRARVQTSSAARRWPRSLTTARSCATAAGTPRSRCSPPSAGTAASSCGRRRATTRRAARPTCPSPAGTSWRTTSERPCAWAYPRRCQHTCMCARSGEGWPHELPEASGCCGCISTAACVHCCVCCRCAATPRRGLGRRRGAARPRRVGWSLAGVLPCSGRMHGAASRCRPVPASRAALLHACAVRGCLAWVSICWQHAGWEGHGGHGSRACLARLFLSFHVPPSQSSSLTESLTESLIEAVCCCSELMGRPSLDREPGGLHAMGAMRVACIIKNRVYTLQHVCVCLMQFRLFCLPHL